MCNTTGQSIQNCSPVAPARIPGGKRAEHPWGTALAARLAGNRGPRRAAGTQMKGAVLFSGKQPCLCHLLLLSSQNDFVYTPSWSADVSPALGIACGGVIAAAASLVGEEPKIPRLGLLLSRRVSPPNFAF